MIEYKPLEIDWRFYRDSVIDRAIRMAAASGQPVALTIAEKTITVQPNHYEQLRAELNAILPSVFRQ